MDFQAEESDDADAEEGTYGDADVAGEGEDGHCSAVPSAGRGAYHHGRVGMEDGVAESPEDDADHEQRIGGGEADEAHTQGRADEAQDHEPGAGEAVHEPADEGLNGHEHEAGEGGEESDIG